MKHVPTVDEIREIDDTRLRLTLAGARILADKGFEILAAGLSPERVARLAGRNRRVFYDYFESKEDFLRTITEQYLDPSETRLIAQLTAEQLAAELRWSEGDMYDSVEQISRLTFAADLESEAGELQLLSWAVGHGDPQVLELLADKFDGINASISHVLTSLFDYWGFQLREPWTVDRFAAAIRALSDGMYVRSRVNPELADPDLFILTILTLCAHAAVPKGSEPVSVRESIQRLSDDAASLWHNQIGSNLVENAYERVVEAYRYELQSRGISRVTMSSVAKRSQFPPELIAQTFASTHDILRAAVWDSLPTLLAEAEFDLTTESISTWEAARRHVVRLSTWIAEEADLARAVLTLSISDPTDEMGVRLASEIITRMAEPAALILKEGVRRGEVRDKMDLLEVAVLTTELMLGRVRAPADFDLGSMSDFITSLLFGGAGRHS